MSDLSQLLTTEKRPAIVSELATFTEQTISEQSGVTGMALKSAVRAAKAVRGDIIEKAINRLLPDILGDLQSFWREFQDSSSDDFGVFVVPRSTQVVDSILSVADRHAEQLPSALSGIYATVRGKAADVIEPVVPDLARIVQRHMG